MLQSVPPRASAKPRLIASFTQPTFVVIQITGANTLYLAETDQQLMMANDDGTIDALQLNQANAPGGLYFLWWNGDLWAAGSQAAGVTFKPSIVISGGTIGSSGIGGLAAYGI